MVDVGMPEFPVPVWKGYNRQELICGRRDLINMMDSTRLNIIKSLLIAGRKRLRKKCYHFDPSQLGSLKFGHDFVRSYVRGYHTLDRIKEEFIFVMGWCLGTCSTVLGRKGIIWGLTLSSHMGNLTPFRMRLM